MHILYFSFNGMESFINLEILLELKQIINSPKWNTAWISLFAEAFGWYMIKNIILRARKQLRYCFFSENAISEASYTQYTV